MRTQRKNRRKFFYAKLIGSEPVKVTDEWGNTKETGEYEKKYYDPIELYANISPAKGEVGRELFGNNDDYDKIISPPKRGIIEETDIFWIDNLVDGKIPLEKGIEIAHDYVVTRIATSLNEELIAVEKVNVKR